MVTTASFFLGVSRSRNSIIEDSGADDLGGYAFSGVDAADVVSARGDTRSQESPSADSAGDAASEQVPKKKKKLKRQRSDLDSDEESADKKAEAARAAAAAAAEREAKEALRKRKAIRETLETLHAFLDITKKMTETVVAGMSGGQLKIEEQIRAAIANGSCTFIRSYSDLSKFSVASKFKNLKLYQQCGVHWLSLLHSVEHANGILADEMGLGKTAQTSVFLSYIYSIDTKEVANDFNARLKKEGYGTKRSCLILVPSSVVDNWCKELRRWAPNLKNHIVKYHGPQSARFKIACDVIDDVSKGSFVILVSTMPTVSSKEDVRLLRGIREFEYMIVDEAHALKNSETIAYRRLNSSFNIRHRLLLTGTPVQNSQSELGNLLQFAMPDMFDQSRINDAINYLIKNYEDAVSEFPALSSLVEPGEIEAYKKTLPAPPPPKAPTKRGRRSKKAAADAANATEADAGAKEAAGNEEPQEKNQSQPDPTGKTNTNAAATENDAEEAVNNGETVRQVDVDAVHTPRSPQRPTEIPKDEVFKSTSFGSLLDSGLNSDANDGLKDTEMSDAKSPADYTMLRIGSMSDASAGGVDADVDRVKCEPTSVEHKDAALKAANQSDSNPSTSDASLLPVADGVKVERNPNLVMGTVDEESTDSFERFDSVQSDGEFFGPDGKTVSIEPSIRVLQRLIAPFILRRRKRTVMHELPAKNTFLIRCKMAGIQQDLYLKEVESNIEQHRNALIQKYKVPESELRNMCHGRSKNYSIGSRDDFLVKSLIFRMRRICNHPLLVRGAYYKEDLLQKLIKYYASKVEGYKENSLERVEKELRSWSDFEMHRSMQSLLHFEPRLERYLIPKEAFMTSAKVVELFKIIDKVEADKRKALVFSQFTMYLDVIEECLRLNKPEVVYLRLDGGCNTNSRTEMVDQFTNDENVRLMLVSTKAGGTGLNLTVASTVVLMDQDWNPHNDTQAEDRCHRIGQTQTVEVYKLLCEGTIEEYVMECCQRKLMLDDAFSGKAVGEESA
ncbi:SNF2 family N-terminal domain containing protein, putative [Babesia bigemina]|uniref:SNF2 family N-terminal domain containing protein, putative n=1 Tax=Babesia bigemina TaxID=5866 RepID=A0A061D983_BABBI|nr:SNF2 family N-terminal domain containing protein, putative [Babesia bigemina]CDR96542.1 SNF2 family N-terminal domain containing protein, putative [Babesia bigemina]|eukprot:XP_012768728.1 SNF2 family N-terminal domain containing protein, putative [Babesia bigemina]